MAKHKIKNLFAFTLAEVLITLGIIGVVAAMTIPTLTTKIQNRQCEVATAKFYSQFTQALKHYIADNEVGDLRYSKMANAEWCDGNGYTEAEATEEFSNFMKTYLKAQEYDKEHIYDNFNESYKNISGKIEKFNYGSKDANYKTINGVSIDLVYPPETCYPGAIIVDINGKSGPNIGGRDLWYLSIFYDGTIGEGGMTPDKTYQSYRYTTTDKEYIDDRFQMCKDESVGAAYGAGCFGHFKLNNFKFDY